MIVLLASAGAEEAALAEQLLKEKQYTVCRVRSAAELTDRAGRGGFSLAVVFSDLYPEDPLGPVFLLKALDTPAPTFFISLAGPEAALHVSALEAGAADAVTLPVSQREFLVRVAHLVSRAPDPPDRPCRQGLSLDREKNRLYYDGKSVSLTGKQALLLELLLKSPNQPRSPEAILQKLWPGETDAGARLFTNVSGLRRALKELGCPMEIRSIRGKGYILE